jgi:hypothetical protein
MTGLVFRRGDLYWGDLDPQKGSEQGGRRPILIFGMTGSAEPAIQS